MKFAASLIALAVIGGFTASVHAGPISGTLSGDSTLTPTGTHYRRQYKRRDHPL
jgi:hypothetical protein